MRLTQFSDYALRTLLYLGVHRDRPVSVAEVARSYRISRHHLVKVAAFLSDLGVVESVRGRGGGYRLAVDPATIDVGWLLRRTEPDFHLVECFDHESDTCPITSACALRGLLAQAQRSFLSTLDGHSVADLLSRPGDRAELVQLWAQRPPARGAVARPRAAGAGSVGPV